MEQATERLHGEQEIIRVGISQGDMNGIGYEVIMKTLQDQRMLENLTPIIYGSSKIASYHRKTLNISDFNFNSIRHANQAAPRKTNILNITNDEVRIELGTSSEISGRLAYQALEQATADLMQKLIDVLVTAPINKKNMQSEEFTFPGHSEYLTRRFNATDHLMLMLDGKLRVGVVTGHLPLKDVSSNLTPELLLKKLAIFNESLIRDFAIRKPVIAVLGLNPHAGDEGLLGDEEMKIIQPGIQKALEKGMLVYGPYPADGFFGSSNFMKFDGILAMYHDQGLVPFKALSFENGVNYTAGLPFIRTSPVHGTAYEIAGKNEASPGSFRAAVYQAIEIFRNRTLYDELHANPLPNYLKDIESSSDAVIEKEIPAPKSSGEGDDSSSTAVSYA